MKVSYSPGAIRDLFKIREFILAESKSEEVASRFIARIFDSCDQLATMPLRHKMYSHRLQTRMMPLGKYVILYKAHDAVVRIQHVRHAARRPFRK